MREENGGTAKLAAGAALIGERLNAPMRIQQIAEVQHVEPELQILLVFEIRIGCDENRVAFLLRRIKQLAVLELGPATLICGGDFMLRQ